MATYIETIEHDMYISIDLSYLQIKYEEIILNHNHIFEGYYRQFVANRLNANTVDLLNNSNPSAGSVFPNNVISNILLQQQLDSGRIFNLSSITHQIILSQIVSSPINITQIFSFIQTVLGSASHHINNTLLLSDDFNQSTSVFFRDFIDNIIITDYITGGVFDSNGLVKEGFSKKVVPQITNPAP